ncbi:MAG TPA: hypothetical protein VM869_37230 [Enhygromyxa sp.]|nr:hypothetical protein [Enhygromyxa sp.]
MKTSAWISAALLAVLVAGGCDKKEEKKPTPKAAAKPAEPTPTPPEPEKPAEPPPAEVTPPTPEPAVEPPPVDDIAGVGPFDSIKAYCKDAKSKFVVEDCKSMLDEGANVCSCNTNNNEVEGKRKIGPLPEATGLASAELVVVNRSAAGGGHCDLAIETANGRGWFFVPALMECTGAPMSHDSGTTVTIDSFEVSRENDEDVLTLAWTETTSDQDVDGAESSSDKKFTTRCTIGASTPPRCAKPSPQQ